MHRQRARAAINEALDKAREGERLEVSPAENGVSSVEFLDVSEEEITKRGGGFLTEWLENGSFVFRPLATLR